MTFLQLRNLVGAWVVDKNFGFHTTADVNLYLNNALLEVQRRLLRTHSHFYKECIYTTLVVGQKDYVLPDDFLCMYDLWIDLEGTAPNQTTLPLEYIPPSKRHDFLPQNGTPTHFWMAKDRLWLATPPDEALTLEMLYAPRAPAMTADADTPDVPEEYHELLAIIATQTCFMVDDKVSTLVDEKRQKYEELLAAYETTMLNAPRYVLTVE